MASPTRFLDRARQSDVKAVEEVIRLIAGVGDAQEGKRVFGPHAFTHYA